MITYENFIAEFLKRFPELEEKAKTSAPWMGQGTSPMTNLMVMHLVNPAVQYWLDSRNSEKILQYIEFLEVACESRRAEVLYVVQASAIRTLFPKLRACWPRLGPLTRKVAMFEQIKSKSVRFCIGLEEFIQLNIQIEEFSDFESFCHGYEGMVLDPKAQEGRKYGKAHPDL